MKIPFVTSEIKIKPAYSGGIIKFGITNGLRKNRPYSFLQGKYIPVKVRKRGVYGVRRGKNCVIGKTGSS